mmetsp:Transcript_43497/g.109790  ORF Transcript_43497/g.109790 Transcript_43497/m.109790 type:complete len:173 (-) Transcript_43497:292-810(-)
MQRITKQTELASRVYFYYINLHGNLYSLDSAEPARLPHGPAFLRDPVFLRFFTQRIALNDTGKYLPTYKYLSKCGKELNFLRCADTCVVFQEMIRENNKHMLQYAPGLKVEFQPEEVAYSPIGRFYHPAGKHGLALIKSSLALELMEGLDQKEGGGFEYLWEGRRVAMKPSR